MKREQGVTMKKLQIMLAIALFGGTILKAGPVADQIKNVQGTFNQLVAVVEPAIDILPGDAKDPKSTKAKYYADNGYKSKLNKISETVAGSYQVAFDVEEFIKNLSATAQTAQKLSSQMSCLNAGSSSCAAVGCDSKNACLAQILKTLNDLLMPVMNQLIARGTKNAQGQMEYNQGALYSLVSLKVIPEETRKKLQMTIGTYASKLGSALAFLNTLAFILNPNAPVVVDMKPEDKKKLEDSVRADPVVIPDETEFPAD